MAAMEAPRYIKVTNIEMLFAPDRWTIVAAIKVMRAEQPEASAVGASSVTATSAPFALLHFVIKSRVIGHRTTLRRRCAPMRNTQASLLRTTRASLRPKRISCSPEEVSLRQRGIRCSLEEVSLRQRRISCSTRRRRSLRRVSQASLLHRLHSCNRSIRRIRLRSSFRLRLRGRAEQRSS